MYGTYGYAYVRTISMFSEDQIRRRLPHVTDRKFSKFPIELRTTFARIWHIFLLSFFTVVIVT